jgi:hypothetical protein
LIICFSCVIHIAAEKQIPISQRKEKEEVGAAKRIVGMGFILLLVCLTTCVGAAETPTKGGTDGGAFKDPHNGGAPLPDGGGEPGKAYMALAQAMYKKDYTQICALNDIVDKNTCDQSKGAIDGLMVFFVGPKEHKVAGGFAKGDSATLNVIYTWANKAESKAIATMERNKNGKWIFTGFSAHAEQQIEAKADATVTLDNSAEAKDSPFGPVSMVASRVRYTGDKCPIEITYTATINFKLPLPKDFTFKYHWERSDGDKGKEQVLSHTGNRKAISITETWQLGTPGQQYDASMKIFIDAGNTHIVKESPTVKVICK